jgi:hypothetical protein
VNVFFTHEQLVRGAIFEGVVKVLDADAKTWKKPKGVIDVLNILAEHEQRGAEKAQASGQRLEQKRVAHEKSRQENKEQGNAGRQKFLPNKSARGEAPETVAKEEKNLQMIAKHLQSCQIRLRF